MSSPANNQPSVLDEIRSTIASLDALRGRSSDPQNGSAVAEATLPSPPPVSRTEPVVPKSAKAAPVKVAQEAQLANAVKAAPASPSAAVPRKQPPVRPGSAESAPASKPVAPVVKNAVPAMKTSVSADSEIADATDDVVAALSPESIVVRSNNVDAKIMIVDDEPLNVMTFRQHLKGEGYSNFVTTENAAEALHLVRSEMPDILLLDIHMPEISGLDILRVMGLDPSLQHIPVLILTASTDPKTRRKALDLGAIDFLSKPIDPNELIPRVRNAIILKKHFDMVANEAARLEQQVERRTRQLEVTRQQLILSLARAAEHRDDDTGNHVIRVGRYAAIIAKELGYPKNKLSMFEQAAQLHDVGKIGIPDSILFKPGRLDPDQYDLMKRHCAIGKQIIEPISEREFEVLKTHTRKGEGLLHVRSSPLLMLAARIAQTHHEKWNGSGYPLGLSGEDIPLEGRIVAVADVFDALSSERPYKKAFPRERCFEILEEGRGEHFDPEVLDAFFRCSTEIVETQLLLMDDAITPVQDHAVDVLEDSRH